MDGGAKYMVGWPAGRPGFSQKRAAARPKRLQLSLGALGYPCEAHKTGVGGHVSTSTYTTHHTAHHTTTTTTPIPWTSGHNPDAYTTKSTEMKKYPS